MERDASLDTTLKQNLEIIGLLAISQIPAEETYTSCCGLFINTHAKSYQARMVTLKVIHWLRFLGSRKDDINDAVLKGALILAEKFLLLHRDSLDEIDLFEEIEFIKEKFNIKDTPDDFDALQEYSNALGHHKYPDIIKNYLKNHRAHETDIEIKIHQKHHFWSDFFCFSDSSKESKHDDNDKSLQIKTPTY